MKKRKLYIIHSEYVQHGMTFNSNNRYVDDPDRADQIYEETLQAMKADNEEMLSCDSYKTQKSSRTTEARSREYFSKIIRKSLHTVISERNSFQLLVFK